MGRDWYREMGDYISIERWELFLYFSFIYFILCSCFCYRVMRSYL